jgi:hypothetical protein
VTAVYISDDAEASASMRKRWEHQVPGVPLVIVESPYRALAGPMMAYLDVLDSAWPPDKPAPITFVVLPEYVARSWWERILYNQSARRLRTVLLGRPHTVIVGVPYRRENPRKHKPGDDDEPQEPHDPTGSTGGRPSAIPVEVAASTAAPGPLEVPGATDDGG